MRIIRKCLNWPIYGDRWIHLNIFQFTSKYFVVSVEYWAGTSLLNIVPREGVALSYLTGSYESFVIFYNESQQIACRCVQSSMSRACFEQKNHTISLCFNYFFFLENPFFQISLMLLGRWKCENSNSPYAYRAEEKYDMHDIAVHISQL